MINLKNPFDTVNLNLLTTTLKRTRLDWRDNRIMMKLYKNQETIMRIGDCVSIARIRRAIRHGYSFSL